MAGDNLNAQYFSGTQASLFIGNVWVDDISAFDYSVQHTRLPQFGYGSQHFDFLPKGNIIVTGSFVINFREPNYLWIILENHKEFNLTADERLKKQKKEDEKEQSLTTVIDRRTTMDKFFNDPSPKDAKDKLISILDFANGNTAPVDRENFNHRAFEIIMGYGYDLGPNSPGEKITNVNIMGKAKVINQDGRPIQEQYQFMARKIV